MASGTPSFGVQPFTSGGKSKIEALISIAPWYKYAFVNNDHGYSNAVKLSTGITVQEKTLLIPNINLSSIHSYKLDKWEPFINAELIGYPNLRSFSAGTSYWYNKKQAVNLSINTSAFTPTSISVGFQQAYN